LETLARSVVRSGQEGEPLPDAYQNLARMGARFRKSGTSMLAGVPGAYKSTIALNLAMRWSKQESTGLYVSADADRFTVGKRCAAILSGDTTDKVEKTLRAGGYSDVLRRIKKVHLEYRPLTIQQIDQRVDAFEQMHGKSPDWIVVDTLMACVAADYNAQMTMCRDLDALSRVRQCHVLIVHHTQEHPPERGGPSKLPPPIWELHGKVSQFPRLILTTAKVGYEMLVGIVKNTNGVAQSDGNYYASFTIDTANCRLEETEWM
jgi:hypothetical protein